MGEGKGLAIAALALGIVGLFTAGGLGVGSVVGLVLAGAALMGASPRAGRDVAWAAVAANLLALLTVLPVGAALWAYRQSPLLFAADDALPVPGPTPVAVDEADLAGQPPPPPLAPPPASQPETGRGRPSAARAEARAKGVAGVPGASPEPLRVGGEIRDPRKTRHVNPVYPEEAIRARVQGVVILECTISPRGKVVNVKTLRSVPTLDAAAIEAVKQWEYTPTLLNGVPVPVIMTVTVNFKLG
jgi:TonB family protein